MRESLRVEFPGAAANLSRLRPHVRREPAAWALLSSLGAALIVSAVLRLVLLLIPAWNDQTVRLPFGATFGSAAAFVAHLAAGVVLGRAGGTRAVLLYLAFVAIQVAASLPGILLFCDRAGAEGQCRMPLVFIAAGRAPEWAGVAVGMLLSRWYPSGGPGANVTLRGAGAFVIARFVLSLPLGYLSQSGGLQGVAMLGMLFVLAEGLAGAVAGVVLARGRLASALLVALAIVGPSFALAVSLLAAGGADGQTLEFTIARWSSALAPIAAAGVLLCAWSLVRRREPTGTNAPSPATSPAPSEIGRP